MELFSWLHQSHLLVLALELDNGSCCGLPFRTRICLCYCSSIYTPPVLMLRWPSIFFLDFYRIWYTGKLSDNRKWIEEVSGVLLAKIFTLGFSPDRQNTGLLFTNSTIFQVGLSGFHQVKGYISFLFISLPRIVCKPFFVLCCYVDLLRFLPPFSVTRWPSKISPSCHPDESLLRVRPNSHRVDN